MKDTTTDNAAPRRWTLKNEHDSAGSLRSWTLKNEHDHYLVIRDMGMFTAGASAPDICFTADHCDPRTIKMGVLFCDAVREVLRDAGVPVRAVVHPLADRCRCGALLGYYPPDNGASCEDCRPG